MHKLNLAERMKHATQESQVQEIYNDIFKQTFKLPIIERKFQCDGYFSTRYNDTDISILIEYKYDIRMKDKIERSRVIAQCIGYLRAFELAGEPLPKLVFIGDINECIIIHTNELLKFLDIDEVNWNAAPSSLGYENNLLLAIIQNINPWVYDITESFDAKEIIDKILSLCKGINQQVHITEKNIEKIYHIFCNRVLKNANKIPANDLVAIFIGAMLDKDNYYKHPNKSVLCARGNNIAINAAEYTAFMNQHSTDYTIKEKHALTSISDRLIEDTNRRSKGEFYTPTIWVDYAHRLIEKELGSHWKDNYAVWDCCCGTKNLTRDYRFKELYCSTLEQAELDISKNYNKEATSFQFDFLNDSLDDLKVKAPGLLNAFENNKPICFFINPPYGTVTLSTGMKTVGNNITEVSKKAKFCIKDLITQFIYRIYLIKEQYELTNVKICLFHNPKWLCGSNYKMLRSIIFNTFCFTDGFMFKSSEFANVSSMWGICFSVFSSANIHKQLNMYKHGLVENDNENIVKIGDKTLYNNDDITFSCAKYIETNNTGKALCKIMCPGNSVHDNNHTFINSDMSYKAGGVHNVSTGNYTRCMTILAARNLIQTNWLIDKDEYRQPNENHAKFNEFVLDSCIYGLFDNQKSYRDHGIRNEMFWMSKHDMLELADRYGNEYTYNDVINSNERYAASFIKEHYNEFSQEAKDVLEAAISLVKDSFQYRVVFNDSHPEYQVNNWDIGIYQLKLMLKEFMPERLKDFKGIYKKLADKMRLMVYELGFLQETDIMK